MGRKRLEVPGDVKEFGERLESWRNSDQGCGRIPAAFWEVAVTLAARHGACRVARATGLSYASLRARLANSSEAIAPVMANSSFTEIDLGLSGCCADLEFVARNGMVLRVRVPLGAAPDLVSTFLGATA